MNGLNKVTLIGHVGKDPEVRYLDKDTAVANFTLATTEKYRDKNNELQSATEWHNIVAWRGLAKTIEKFVKKGDPLYIEGKIKAKSWDDNGTKKYMTEILADTMIMLGSKKEGSEQSAPSNNGTYTASKAPVSNTNTNTPAEEDIDYSQEESDDLPF